MILLGSRRDIHITAAPTPIFRGFYFTSGTQEGTPIDRVMGLLAAIYRLDRQNMPVFSGQGKSFFITRLDRTLYRCRTTPTR